MIALIIQRGSGKKALPVMAPAGEMLSVFYASQKGHGKRFAELLVAQAHEYGVAAMAVDVAGFDTDKLVEVSCAVFIVATYAGGSAVPGTEFFFSELTEMSRDFRVEKTLLAGTTYAVFGCGNSEYPPKDFNAVARRLDRAMRLLGGRRQLARREGDDVDNALSEQFEAWLHEFLEAQGGGGGAASNDAGLGADAMVRLSEKQRGKTKAQIRRLERLQKQGKADMAKAAAEAAARLTAAADDGKGGGECCGGGVDGGECCGGGGRSDVHAAVASSGEAEAGDACCGGGEGRRGGECFGGGGGGGGGGGAGAERASTGGSPAAANDEPSFGGCWPTVDDDVPSGFDARGEALRPLPEESDEESDAGQGGSDGGYGSDGGALVDMEDMGGMILPRSDGTAAAVGKGAAAGEVAVGGKWSKTAGPETAEADRKPMVTPSLRASLTKQGYKIVGSCCSGVSWPLLAAAAH